VKHLTAKQWNLLKQEKILVAIARFIYEYNNTSLFTVIKAEIITEESIRLAQQPYMFPDKDDNMESFTGRSGQVLLPNMLLQEVLDKLPEGIKMCC